MAVAITRTADPAGVAASSLVATYSSVSIGTASSDRIVAVTAGCDTTATIDSATIDYGSGDTAMTSAASATAGNQKSRTFYLAAPTGTTATIKITFGGSSPSSTRNHISVYSVTGASATLHSSGNDSSLDMDATDPLTTGSITIPTDGGFLAHAYCGADTVAKTWANATEDLDTDVGNSRNTTAISTTPGTVTITCTGTTDGEDGALTWVIFSPSSSAASTSDMFLMFM